MQRSFDEPYLHIGIDWLIDTMPDRLNDWTGAPAPLGFSWKQAVDPQGHTIHEIQAGPYARRIGAALLEVALALAALDFNLIVDDVSPGKEANRVWKEAFADYRLLTVGVTAPLPILEMREQARGDRMPGSARGQHATTHADAEYDLWVDTSTTSLSASAARIQKALLSL